jgi:NADPH:quinone reductase-like Zn-dependent oxidoreductase
VAGTVVRVGSKVRQFKPGDEIYARPRDGRVGTFAELISINEADVALKPKGLSTEEDASIPLASLTACQVLVEKATLRKGQKILIYAGSGGVGTFAIQLAKHLGATVATTTSTTNVELVKSLGADIVIDYKKVDFSKVLSGCGIVLNSLDKETREIPQSANWQFVRCRPFAAVESQRDTPGQLSAGCVWWAQSRSLCPSQWDTEAKTSPAMD